MQIKVRCGLGRVGCLDGSTGTAVGCPFRVAKTGNTRSEQMTSALPPKADSSRTSRQVRFVPNSEVTNIVGKIYFNLDRLAEILAGFCRLQPQEPRIRDRGLPVLDRLAIDGVAQHIDEGLYGWIFR